MKARGFTLAEVLIALALLGIVAAFTIPKVLQSQGEAKKIAVFKEAMASLFQIQEEGRLKKNLELLTFGTYYLQRLNSVKTCDINARTQGCWDDAQGLNHWNGTSGSQDEPGAVLANGASIVGLRNFTLADPLYATSIASGEWYQGIVIDWNGKEGPNAVGDDQLTLLMCYGPKGCVRGFVTPNPQPSGTIYPLNTNTLDATWGPNNVLLYRKIMQ